VIVIVVNYHILIEYKHKKLFCTRTFQILVEQELPTLPEHLRSPQMFSGGSCYSIFSFMCNVLYVVVCPFVSFLLTIGLYFFNLRIMINPLASSNSSNRQNTYETRTIYCCLIKIEHPFVQTRIIFFLIKKQRKEISCDNSKSTTSRPYQYSH
jgi:hypothetical protein